MDKEIHDGIFYFSIHYQIIFSLLPASPHPSHTHTRTHAHAYTDTHTHHTHTQPHAPRTHTRMPGNHSSSAVYLACSGGVAVSHEIIQNHWLSLGHLKETASVAGEGRGKDIGVWGQSN